MQKNLKDFYEDYWKFREDTGKIYNKEGGQAPVRLKEVASMIRETGRGTKVLDVGCGDGTLGMLLKERADSVRAVGCDLSEGAVEYSRPWYDKVFQVNIEEDDLREKAGEDGFDYVICVEVIEHVMHPGAALTKCKELLSPNGYLIVSFPNIAWWKYRLSLLRGHFPEESRFYHHAEHLHDFTMHSFSKLLKDAGLEPVEIGGEFVLPKFMQRIMPKGLVERLVKRYPNLFGYQVVIKARPI